MPHEDLVESFVSRVYEHYGLPEAEDDAAHGAAAAAAGPSAGFQ